MRHLLSLCTFLSSLWLMACQPNSIAPLNAQDVSLPASYAALENASPAQNIYVSAEHACDDTHANDGRSPRCENGHGPFPTLLALKNAAKAGRFSIAPGLAIIFRDGTYDINKLFISKSGTEDKPISILAYPGEKPVFDGGYRPGDKGTLHLDTNVVLGLRGKYLVMSGFRIQGCKEVCVQIGGQHILFKNNTIIGGGEDGIKVPPGSDHVYIVGNRFEWPESLNMPSRPKTPEALDFMGAKNSYAINNLFTNSDVRWGGWGSVMWAKGGARNVHMLGNRFENLVVKNNAIILGGCCFNNWDWLAGNGLAKPVARYV
ncbi:MAG: right-handed parallel beta-helix repeat-containing protein, partial [Myxococcota bacterium]|nr:right-handed parallel beta-helix repeat-containing protein [Myxococcota bacterium]